MDSEPLGHRAMASVLAEHGVEVDAAALQEEFRGWELARELDVLADRHRTRLGPAVVTRYRQRLAELFDAELLPLPGAREAVLAARAAGCAVAVASGGPMQKITQALAVTGLAELFGASLYSSYDVGSFKPEPGLFLHVARHQGVDPSRCLVVEDSAVGVEAARRAGMTVVHVEARASTAALPAGVARLKDLHGLAAAFAPASGVR